MHSFFHYSLQSPLSLVVLLGIPFILGCTAISKVVKDNKHSPANRWGLGLLGIVVMLPFFVIASLGIIVIIAMYKHGGPGF